MRRSSARSWIARWRRRRGTGAADRSPGAVLGAWRRDPRARRGAGFGYDSSLMWDDYRLARVRHGDRHSTDDGTTFGREGSLVEVPVYWALDDWPFFEPGPGRDGLSAPSRVLEIWLAELRYAHDHAPGGLLTVTMHPECIGRGHRISILETLIAEAKALDGVVFDRLDHYVDAWLGVEANAPDAEWRNRPGLESSSGAP